MPRNDQVSRVITAVPPGGYWPDLLFQNYDADDCPCSPGFRIADSLGRAWRLVHTNEVVVAGNMLTNLVTECAIAATKFDADPIGESELDIDITVVADAYNFGFLLLTEGTSAGHMYPVVSNTVGTAGTTDSTVKIEGQLVLALSASDTVGMLRNSLFYNCSIHNHADPCLESPVGRAMHASTTAKPYIWAQTWGPCLLLAGTGAVGAGDAIGLDEQVSGTVETQQAGESPCFVGNAVQAGAATAWCLCNLMLFP